MAPSHDLIDEDLLPSRIEGSVVFAHVNPKILVFERLRRHVREYTVIYRYTRDPESHHPSFHRLRPVLSALRLPGCALFVLQS